MMPDRPYRLAALAMLRHLVNEGLLMVWNPETKQMEDIAGVFEHGIGIQIKLREDSQPRGTSQPRERDPFRCEHGQGWWARCGWCEQKDLDAAQDT